jgi:hypothetical protein
MEITSTPEMLQTYEQMREVANSICTQAMHGIEKKDLQRIGATLGLVKGNNFVFKNESESAILLDYSMHHDYKHGHNPLNRYLATMKPKLSELEISVLNSMLNATFTFIILLKTLPHGGVLVQDIVNQEKFILMDKNLSNLDESILGNGAQLVFGATLIPFRGFAMTTGTPILLTRELVNGIEQPLKTFLDLYPHFTSAPKEAQSAFVAEFLKTSINVDAADSNQYA